MLTSLQIHNFRLFKQLEIAHLNRVNLMVGQNNSGKSALLEAISIYINDASTEVIADLINTRQETWTSVLSTTESAFQSNPIRHLFYNHKLPALGEEGIIIGPSDSIQNCLHIRTAAYELREDETGRQRWTLLTSIKLDENLTEIELSVIAQEGDKIRRVLRLDREMYSEVEIFRRSARTILSVPKYISQTVPTRNITDERVATLWDSILLTGFDKEVIHGLQLVDKDIVDVGFVESRNVMRRSSVDYRIPIVKTNRFAEPLPLRSMGDGLVRIFHIIIALANARNGILLIDEFENGIHWSVQPKLWKTIFRLAQDLNVQVFATTHSRDCIKGFEQAWKEDEQTGSFFRINNPVDQKPVVTPYDLETLSDALDTDVEVR